MCVSGICVEGYWLSCSDSLPYLIDTGSLLIESGARLAANKLQDPYPNLSSLEFQAHEITSSLLCGSRHLNSGSLASAGTCTHTHIPTQIYT